MNKKTIKIKHAYCFIIALFALTTGIGDLNAANLHPTPRRRPLPPAEPLTALGEKLSENYKKELQSLQQKINKSLPRIDEKLKASFLKSYQGETAAAINELKAFRAKRNKHVKDSEGAAKAYDEAKEALNRAVKNAQAPSQDAFAVLDAFLADDKLDSELVKCAVLADATPKGLAEYAQQGKDHEALVEKLLSDSALMKKMLVAGGAEAGRYGQAMEIYTAIQKASPRAAKGEFQRLALGIALELALPVRQSNAKDKVDAAKYVDPVKRYLAFEKAYLDGELDPAFKNLTAWEYRNVVNGDEPDEILAWGRQMLRNYRPDLIAKPYNWRYVRAVVTEVRYGTQDQKYDLPSRQRYQNIINNGGICGRRAWFGGFILRCFGIPIVRRPQPGHAALAHWTPDGWVECLSIGEWKMGWTKYGEGLDFEAYTKARKDTCAYMSALRAKWIGKALGEPNAFGLHEPASGFWNGIALFKQRGIVKASNKVSLKAVGQDLAEANVSKVKEIVKHVKVTGADKTVVVAKDGTITIPAVACRIKPVADSKKKKNGSGRKRRAIAFMKSNLGGLQMHYNRLANPRVSFEYSFDVPKAGTYLLSARVVTVSPGQVLLATVNDATDPVALKIPYTIGMWQYCKPVNISLKKGVNVIRFDRSGRCKGITIKDFKLTPTT